MDANGPLAKENDRKLNFHVKEVSTWTVQHVLLSGSSSGNVMLKEAQPVLPSASLTSRFMSAGMFAPRSLAPPSFLCYLLLLGHM